MENMTLWKVLVTVPVTQAQKKLLTDAGGERCIWSFLPRIKVTREILRQQDILIGNLPPALLAGCDNLKWVQLNSAGADLYTGEGILPPDCLLTSAVGAYGLAVSEHMLALTFALIRRLEQYMRNQQKHVWKSMGQIISVEESTVLILGLGDIGSSYAVKMKALGARTIGIRRTPAKKPDFLDEQYTLEKLDEILPRADIVAMIVPENAESFHMMNAERLSLMKKGAFLINAGRGTAVEPDALLQALRSGHLGGAALDVTEPEPVPKDHPLWDLENLIITPHVAGQFFLPETVNRIIRIAADNLRAFPDEGAMRNITPHK